MVHGNKTPENRTFRLLNVKRKKFTCMQQFTLNNYYKINNNVARNNDRLPSFSE